MQFNVKRESSPMETMQQQAPAMEAPTMEMPAMEEPVVNAYEHPGCDDQIGDVHVVLKPGPESKIEDILHKTHAFGVHQFDPQTVHGIYGDEGEANLVGEGAIRELHKHLTKMEKKKDMVLEKIGKRIHLLQKEINNHMKSANERPEEADAHHVLAQRKMDSIRELRGKHKVVKESKRALPEKNKE